MLRLERVSPSLCFWLFVCFIYTCIRSIRCCSILNQGFLVRIFARKWISGNATRNGTRLSNFDTLSITPPAHPRLQLSIIYDSTLFNLNNLTGSVVSTLKEERNGLIAYPRRVQTYGKLLSYRTNFPLPNTLPESGNTPGQVFSEKSLQCTVKTGWAFSDSRGIVFELWLFSLDRSHEQY